MKGRAIGLVLGMLSAFCLVFFGLTSVSSAASISVSPGSGSPGTSVTITGHGTNFTSSNVQSVKFNNTSAQFTVNSKTQISTAVPSGATTGQIAVKQNSGTLKSSSFTVTAPLPPASFTFSSSATTVNYGDSVTFSWTATNANWCYGTNWSTLTPGSSNWVQPPDQNTAVPGNVSGSVTVGPLTSNQTYSLNCDQNGRNGTAKSISITVNGQPPPSNITSFDPASAFIGTTVNIHGSNFTGVGAVKFNTTAAGSYTVADDTLVQATVANGTSSGKISVSNNVATSTSANSLNVITTAPAFNYSVCKADNTGCVPNGGTLNVNYNDKVILKWSATNVSWCWGYRWATLPQDSDGSGWVQPPDQTTVPGTPVTEQQYTTLGLTSAKSFSLDCGQPNNPAPLQTVNVTVGNQATNINSFSPDHGSENTNVVITGTGFTNVKGVLFGINANSANCNNSHSKPAASYTVAGTTQITAIVPRTNNLQNGLICVKNVNGATTYAKSTSIFTVSAPPSFTFQVCKADGTACADNPANVNSGDTVQLKWTVNNQVTWCWGSGGDWGGGSWVQPPDQTHPGLGGSVNFKLIGTTTFILNCGAPGNPAGEITRTVAVIGLPPPHPPTGAYPYLQINGGDIFTGGGFSVSSGGCDPKDPAYQAPQHPGLLDSQGNNEADKDDLQGGILSFGMSPNQGSKTDQAVFALGGIVNDITNSVGSQTYGRTGFMSPAANQLTFANVGTFGDIGFTKPYWGGKFEGATQTHCVPDYYGTKRDLPKTWPGQLKNLASGQYLVDEVGNTPVQIDGAKINTTQNISLFVNGDAYITDDITYDTNHETINDIPKLAIIVSGNIYIDSKVTQLDGFYIAQPQEDDACGADGGICHGKIFTCHDKSSNPIPDRLFISKSCRKQLTIYGALVAADVEFDRVGGDMTGVFDDNRPAEIINFTPEMVLGGSFFHGPSAATSNQSKIDSIISLPPIF